MSEGRAYGSAALVPGLVTARRGLRREQATTAVESEQVVEDDDEEAGARLPRRWRLGTAGGASLAARRAPLGLRCYGVHVPLPTSLSAESQEPESVRRPF